MISKYYHTLKYLKFGQLSNRFTRKFYKAKLPKKITAKKRTFDSNSIEFLLLADRVFSNDECVFLNVKGNPTNWQSESHSKLWIYNLHYFDDLISVNYKSKESLHNMLIGDWVENNPVLLGDGWEPYPLSLRIVNWVKYFILKKDVDEIYLDSLKKQVAILFQTIEYHLLGNHLLANAKALVFAGIFFEGKDTEKWLDKGLSIIKSQKDEQILSDGGNFELSPMYHNIVTIDFLDLINVLNFTKRKRFEKIITDLEIIAQKMLHWGSVMTHPDGHVSMFNDSAIGVAPTYSEIADYACQLGLVKTQPLQRLVTLEPSGYSRISDSKHVLIFDHAAIGPDYLPGHAHADSLSIEWSVNKQRVLVNTGTSIYGLGAKRLKQRQTKSHNTIVVNDLDSSEVWSGFRVARRAYSRLISSEITSNVIKLEAEHNGYQRLKNPVIHNRQIISTNDKIIINDTLVGKWQTAKVYFHFHPDLQIVQINSSEFLLTLSGGEEIHFKSSSDDISMINSHWSPEFGKNIPNIKLEICLNSIKVTSEFHILNN